LTLRQSASERCDIGDPNPGYGGRTALRGLAPSLAASSVSWLAARAFSRGQCIRVGLTSAGIRLTDITALKTAVRPDPDERRADQPNSRKKVPDAACRRAMR